MFILIDYIQIKKYSEKNKVHGRRCMCIMEYRFQMSNKEIKCGSAFIESDNDFPLDELRLVQCMALDNY
jgi:hypothetical protein